MTTGGQPQEHARVGKFAAPRGEGQKSVPPRPLDPRPPHSGIFFLADYFSGKARKMTDFQGDLFQAIENVDQISGSQQNSDISEPLFSEEVRTSNCVICAASFFPARRDANVCSPACRRARKLRYGAAYRQYGRDGKQWLHDLFGGRRPTQEEFLRIVQQRKGRS